MQGVMNSYFFTVAGSLLFPSCATVSLLCSLAVLFAWLTPSFDMSIWRQCCSPSCRLSKRQAKSLLFENPFLFISFLWAYVNGTKTMGVMWHFHVFIQCTLIILYSHSPLLSPVLSYWFLCPLFYFCVFFFVWICILHGDSSLSESGFFLFPWGAPGSIHFPAKDVIWFFLMAE